MNSRRQGEYAPFFETVIRYLGGLLSAYALSGEPILLARADDLGTMLLPAFNTTHGLPMYAVNTVTCVASFLLSLVRAFITMLVARHDLGGRDSKYCGQRLSAVKSSTSTLRT